MDVALKGELLTEAVSRGCSVKKMLKILQNSQENTCAIVLARKTTAF